MDRVKAEALEAELQGKSVGGWNVHALINHGKSAAVFRASRDGAEAAIKIFDTELIERYGDATQVARIEREVALVGKSHENLVAIYGGGHDPATGFYFIVMEYLPGKNLKERLSDIRPEQIPSLVEQLAAAAHYLEELELAHRDIKPENIWLSDDCSRLVLLDLGVIRPFGLAGLTDPDGIQAFVGTLQYSSPEFLLREEKDTPEGWRSLTFYQIGAVLHDMIMKRPIFEQFVEPYAKLVLAVQGERPSVTSADVDPRLLSLAERCLLKIPENRLRLVDWTDFRIPAATTPHLSAKDRVSEAMATLRAAASEAPVVATPMLTAPRMREIILKSLKAAAIAARLRTAGLPPIEITPLATPQRGLCFHLKSGSAPFSKGLAIWVDVDVIDVTEGVVSCVGLAAVGLQTWDSLRSQAGEWHAAVYDNVALTSAFEEFFFAAVEWFIRVAPGLTNGAAVWTLPSAED